MNLLVWCVAAAPILGCTSDSMGTADVNPSVDLEAPGEIAIIADVVTLTDVVLDTLPDIAIDLPDVVSDMTDSEVGLDGFQVNQGCEDVVPTDLCSWSCPEVGCGYGNCGVDCGSCPEGMICDGSTCKEIAPGPGCDQETDPSTLPSGDLLTTAVYCQGTCDDAACATSCVAAATGLSESCSSCVAAYGGCAVDACKRCEPFDWFAGCAGPECEPAFFACSGRLFPL